MPGKCKEKYGKEWSEELIGSTREIINKTGYVLLKHIGEHPSCLCFDMSKISTDDFDDFVHTVLAFSRDAHDLKRYLLTSVENVEFYAAYNSIDEIIDDGWAISDKI